MVSIRQLQRASVSVNDARRDAVESMGTVEAVVMCSGKRGGCRGYSGGYACMACSPFITAALALWLLVVCMVSGERYDDADCDGIAVRVWG
jgi:hypothetical protein